MLMLFIGDDKILETTFSNFRDCFHRFLLNYTEFVHETSHTEPSKYDSTSGAKISIMFEKNRWDEAVDRNKHL